MRRVGISVVLRQVLTNYFCIHVKNWLCLNARGLIWKLTVDCICVFSGWLNIKKLCDVWCMTCQCALALRENMDLLCVRAFLLIYFETSKKNLVFYLPYATVQCKQRSDYKSSLYLASLAFIIGEECCSNINIDTSQTWT